MDQDNSLSNDSQAAGGQADRQANWARPVSKLKVTDVPSGAMALNLDGRQVVSPIQGFGPMWQRTYRIRLSEIRVTPGEVIKDWKEKFATFQPPENHFYPSLAGVKPGEMVFINTKLPFFPGTPGIIPMKSGVMVLYADEELFTVMTPEGFPISGWNSFSAYEEDGCTIAQVQGLLRTSDPIYEMGYRLMGGEKAEDKVWFHVLHSLASRWGASGEVEFHKELVDPGIQWGNAKNIWKNAAIRTFFYVLGTPFRWVSGLVKR